MEDLSGWVFMASLSEFDQTLREDPTVNCLDESLLLWEELLKSKVRS